MIPIRTTVDVPGVPGAVIGLIIANLAVFLVQTALPAEVAELFIRHNALIPGRYGDAGVAEHLGLSPYNVLPFLTSSFLHADVVHLIVNMWTLWLFGRPVEQRLGAVRFVIVYLASGVAGDVVHLAFHLQSTVPTLGASGAIAGILGAYALCYPRSKIVLLFFFFFFPWTYELTATVYMALWFVFQLVPGVAQILAPDGVGGIAWWAHIGGFVAGLVLVHTVGSRRQREKAIGPAHSGVRLIGAERPRVVRVRSGPMPGSRPVSKFGRPSSSPEPTTANRPPVPARVVPAREPAVAFTQLARSPIPDSAPSDAAPNPGPMSPPSESQSAIGKRDAPGPWG